jgi:hypothetical protein
MDPRIRIHTKMSGICNTGGYNNKVVLCYRVGAGYSHSLFIVRNQTEQDRKEIEKFPVLDQSKMD